MPNPAARVVAGLKPLIIRALASDGQPVRIISGTLRGRLLPHAVASKYIGMVFGRYEASIQRVLVEHARGCSVAYDVGAHVGFMTLLLAHTLQPGGQVHAFEPSAREALLVEDLVRVNQMTEVVFVHACAVCDENGPVTFTANSFTGILEKAVEKSHAGVTGSVTIPGITLDEFVFGRGGPPPGIIKIDVESAEPLVLAGAARLIAERRPKMLIEVHGPAACEQTLRQLLSVDYRVEYLGPQGQVPVTSSTQLAATFRKGKWTSHVLALPK
jgi:hypothetical protein